MFSTNSYYPINILTQRGILELQDVVPGDYVYEYGTNNLLKVIGIDLPNTPTIINHIIYNDRRADSVRDQDQLYIGDGITSVMTINHRDHLFKEIKQYPVEFKSTIQKPLTPDPYLAGALLTFGALNDPHVNLPYYFSGSNELFAYKYGVDYSSDSIGLDGRVYFKFIGDPKGSRITWDQLFKGNPVTPDSYVYSTIKNRQKFIRGVFDMGYSPKIFTNNRVGVICNNQEKLKIVQRVLWSLGISSLIDYDDFIDPFHNNKYKLEVIGEKKGYPGFSYIVDNIEHLFYQDNVYRSEEEFRLMIRPCTNSNILGFSFSKGLMGNLILEKEQAVYLGANFIPRVSV